MARFSPHGRYHKSVNKVSNYAVGEVCYCKTCHLWDKRGQHPQEIKPYIHSPLPRIPRPVSCQGRVCRNKVRAIYYPSLDRQRVLTRRMTLEAVCAIWSGTCRKNWEASTCEELGGSANFCFGAVRKMAMAGKITEKSKSRSAPTRNNSRPFSKVSLRVLGPVRNG